MLLVQLALGSYLHPQQASPAWWQLHGLHWRLRQRLVILLEQLPVCRLLVILAATVAA